MGYPCLDRSTFEVLLVVSTFLLNIFQIIEIYSQAKKNNKTLTSLNEKLKHFQ